MAKLATLVSNEIRTNKSKENSTNLRLFSIGHTVHAISDLVFDGPDKRIFHRIWKAVHRTELYGWVL